MGKIGKTLKLFLMGLNHYGKEVKLDDEKLWCLDLPSIHVVYGTTYPYPYLRVLEIEARNNGMELIRYREGRKFYYCLKVKGGK